MKNIISLILLFMISINAISTAANGDYISIDSLINQERVYGIKDTKEKEEIQKLVEETAMKSLGVNNVNEINIHGGFKIYDVDDTDLIKIGDSNVCLANILNQLPFRICYAISKKQDEEYQELELSKNENGSWKYSSGDICFYPDELKFCSDETNLTNLLKEKGITKGDYFAILSINSFCLYNIIYVKQGDKEFYIPLLNESNYKPWWFENKKVYNRDDEEIQAWGLEIKYNITHEFVGEPAYPIWAFVDKKYLNLDVRPFLNENENNLLFVPIRQISEALGANVKWDEKGNSVTITSGDDVIKFQIDSNLTKYDIISSDSSISIVNNIEQSITSYYLDNSVAYKNDKPINLKYAIESEKERTLVPIDFIKEIFNINFSYNEKAGIVKINTIKQNDK